MKVMNRYILILVLASTTLLCLLLGLILIETFRMPDQGNGFVIIKITGLNFNLTKGPVQLQIGIVFCVIVAPVILIITIINALYFYFFKKNKNTKNRKGQQANE